MVRLGRISLRSTLSWLLVVLSSLLSAWGVLYQYELSVRHQLHEDLQDAMVEYKSKLEGLTINSRVMGGAILMGIINDAIKKMAAEQLPVDAPEVLSLLRSMLEEYEAEDVFVANASGIIVAYQTMAEGGKSGTGNNIAFRPYFRQAIHGKPSVYAAVGTTNNKRGFYFAAPVYAAASHHSPVIGVVVIKVRPDAVDRWLSSGNMERLLLSPQGVVFAANKEEYLFRFVGAMNAEIWQELKQARQFGKQFEQQMPQPLAMDLNSEWIQIADQEYALAQTSIEWHDPLGAWKLVLLEELTDRLSTRQQWQVFLFSFALSLLLFSAAWMAWQNFHGRQLETQARLQLQNQLADKMLLLETVIGNLQQGLVAYDSNLQLILCNYRFKELLEVPDHLLQPGSNFQELLRYYVMRQEFGPGDPEQIFQQKMGVLEERYPHQFERMRPNGTILEIKGGPLPGGGFVSTYSDITRRRRSEQQIRTLSSAVEQSPVAIVITDPQARMEYVNPAFCQTSGYTPEELLGQPAGMLRSGKTPTEIYQEMWQALHKGEAWSGELLNCKKSGEPFWESLTIAPIRNQENQVIHYLANKVDITERKEADKQLRKALQLISSSILYASRIQRSILAPDWLLSAEFPDHFVLWRPRDVVGGDMYWHRPWVTGTLLLLADCTGHGVPGAFMTLIANGALDQALLETPPGDTATLLQRMHNLVQFALGQDRDEGEADDGLELGVCFLQGDQHKLTFSGARFSLFVVKEESVEEIKGERSGIGYRRVPRRVTFATHVVELHPEWGYYMSSDGLIDQLGGEKRRAFGKPRFMELLASLRPLPMVEHGPRIEQALLDYQGQEERRDDVSVIGFRGVMA
ncbi:PAS-domain containing protein [Candidatus Magnetaquicoccus inordinatus]|uniref:PAS-domain containing protein n=1 Tax=Candidatus Magnetaquicoccus inordinatus TaxID=2496818 RepID=UPI00102C4C76|nr:PAS-domain containing protein [Candidatus Magnetaquicoccus inordinatus]